MPINALPTPPSRTDPTNFAARGDAFMAALPAFVTQANETATAMNLNSTTDASTSSVLIGTGAKTFTVTTGKSFQPGMWLVIASTAAPSTNAMNGIVTNYSGTTLAVDIKTILGGGTIAAWTISQSSPGGTASLVGNTPAGNIVATTVQGALNELDAEKASAGANTDITSLSGLTTGISGVGLGNKIQPITASVAANALTVTVSPSTLDFRSPTLTSGAVTARTLAAAASVVVPSTATLGTVSGVQSRIVVLLLDNAGTLEPAVVNIAGGNDLTETGVISTTAISATATAANVIYSTTARTGVAYRVVGYVESTQATAGTWVSTMNIQGAGGQALSTMSSLGYGQRWQDVTASRTIGTTYYNATGRPIVVSITTSSGASVNDFWNLTIGGLLLGRKGQAYAASALQSVEFLVPVGASYLLTYGQGGAAPGVWAELR